MSEQQQLAAWRILGAMAVALALATVYLYVRSQRRVTGLEHAYRIVYVTDTAGRPQIIHCRVDGSDCRQLSQGDSSGLMPSAAPPSVEEGGGPRVAFLGLDPQSADSQEAGLGVSGSVCVMGLASGQTAKVSAELDRVVGVAPSWSPDGKQIAFGGVEDLNADGAYDVEESGVYVSDVSSGDMRRVATGLLGGWKLSWSPAGNLLLARGMEPGEPVPFVYALDTSSGIAHTHPEIGQITTACWSPEGDRVAAFSREDHRIHILDTEGNQLYAFEAPYGDVLELIWVAGDAEEDIEGRFFAVSGLGFELGAGPLYQRSASADAQERWTAVVGGQSYTALLSASPDGRYVAFTRFTSEQEGDLFVLERGDQQARQLTSDPGFEGAATFVLMP
jgi:Tol biopolymer transport system component